MSENEHKHEVRIYVNGVQKEVPPGEVTFEQIVALAFPTPVSGQNILYTVSYDDGPPPNRSGSLIAGQKVVVTDGMIFNVTATDKS